MRKVEWQPTTRTPPAGCKVLATGKLMTRPLGDVIRSGIPRQRLVRLDVQFVREQAAGEIDELAVERPQGKD